MSKGKPSWGGQYRTRQNTVAGFPELIAKELTIPVVAEDNPNKVLGLLRHEDLITAYNREIIKRKFEEEYVPTY